MNITPQAPTIPIPTVANPATEALRRENHQREVITQPAAAQQSASEKGVASERERAKSPAQQNEQVDFAEIQKKLSQQNRTISDEQGAEDQAQEQETDTKQQAQATDKSEQISDPEIQREIKELKLRDQEVRAHEQAHAATGGVATGAPSYSFEVGPDGKKYAVEGEVSVDLTPVSGDPRATITKMQKVYNAALAPANPSIQDMRVASSAARIITQAQSQLLDQAQQQGDEETKSSNFEPSTNTPNRDRFNNETVSTDDNGFDQFINQTLESQEAIAPTRALEIDARAQRIESFYSNINQAYERPANYQFELTA
ncbi:hypothetical protein tinsulaeT_20600 [Thalassotalea insulae]|uniref:SprA family protein n=1 Tax=Thalassotalea insulae TaxID=2056778 RepID=A0ABQ6GRZ1_9GAMM|nr:putative metalloprotease CJM1_0395 family protein [Thalassotalea insulae]GLX78720.1 hypothetical protein tinsulaeT_20600 [Thalassotalea insulae]